MSTDAHLNPEVRHDMVILFDVTDGNPNGDPDSGNQPRMDDESGHGLVTDVALKRKIRNTLPLAADDPDRYSIFVEAGHALNTRAAETMSVNNIDTKKKKLTPEELTAARSWLCLRYADIRLFGAVLSTGETKSLGQIYGPLQISNARSVDPVSPKLHTITRVTQTTQGDIDKGESTEFGNKWTVPYGLYKAEIYYSANRAKGTGVDSRDLEMLYRSLEMMFDHDRSATRGTMTTRGLYVFSHDSAFGNAPAHKLLERIKVNPADGSAASDGNDVPPRQFADYVISVDDNALPNGITLTKLVA